VTLAALVATVAPLPDWLELMRPDFVALTVLWFTLLSPRLTGLFYAWGAGLALDAFNGVLLGQHALAMIVIAYVASKLRLQVRLRFAAAAVAVILALLFLASSCCSGSTASPAIRSPTGAAGCRFLSAPPAGSLVTGLYSRVAARRIGQGAPCAGSARMTRSSSGSSRARCSRPPWSLRSCCCWLGAHSGCRCCSTSTISSCRRATGPASSRCLPIAA
jgi:rod shape-determining protein MreD